LKMSISPEIDFRFKLFALRTLFHAHIIAQIKELSNA
jgi:hypothetical protein